MRWRRDIHWDAVLFLSSAALAAGVLALASVPQFREWARIAVWGYVAGGFGAAVAGLARKPSPRVRVALTAAVFVAASLAPMALEVWWRARTQPGLHAQSEIIVTEEAAKALIHGRDPYGADFSRGPLSARPKGTRTHFPYLPGMLVFGLPRAIGGDRAPFDARVWFALATLAMTAMALARWPASADRKLRAAQLFLVVPTGALLAATGGDDLPVVALLLVALALAEEGRTVFSAAAAGVAAAVKQTAWPLLPFLAVALARRSSPRERAVAGAVAGAVWVGMVGPFFGWGPGSFLENVVKFPLGLGAERSAAGTPTLGSVLVRAAPPARGAITAALFLVVASAAAALLVRHPPRDARDAAVTAGLVFALAMILAPAARVGYVVYPVTLLAWGFLLRQGPDRPAATRSRPTASVVDVRDRPGLG